MFCDHVSQYWAEMEASGFESDQPVQHMHFIDKQTEARNKDHWTGHYSQYLLKCKSDFCQSTAQTS